MTQRVLINYQLPFVILRVALSLGAENLAFQGTLRSVRVAFGWQRKPTACIALRQ